MSTEIIWIPVAERLPSNTGPVYLVSIDTIFGESEVDIAHYDGKGFSRLDDSYYYINDSVFHVTAWAEKPKPYKPAGPIAGESITADTAVGIGKDGRVYTLEPS